MKQRTFLFLLIASIWPLVCIAAESAFYSHEGTYTLSPTTSVTIAADESSHLLKATLTSGGGSVTLGSAHPGDPFLVYWDAAKQTLWWATTQNVGNWIVQDPHRSAGMTTTRTSPAIRDDQIAGIPPVFAAELAHSLPRRP